MLFVGELLTHKRIQHPGWDGHLHVIGELDDHAVRRIASEPPNDLYVFTVEGMVPVVNDRGRRFMGSVRMRCGTRTRPISWKRAPTCGRFSSCSATLTSPTRPSISTSRGGTCRLRRIHWSSCTCRHPWSSPGRG